MLVQRPRLTPAACSMCCGDVEPDVSGSHSMCTHCGDERVALFRFEPRPQAPVFTNGVRPPALFDGPAFGPPRYLRPGGYTNERA
jgi:hypothetical protein